MRSGFLFPRAAAPPPVLGRSSTLLHRPRRGQRLRRPELLHQPRHRRKWSTQHCEFTGNAVDQTRAEALGQAVFGRLLTESNHA
ncbi:hypothetical protein OHA61_37330 [Streptomyces sp. NBC_00885]|uniref:hypothetical protein n=1 Tax=Streptomyces sp. NBC_00885 TaxID=2975857 RepID=UPI003863F54B|nr:hypothetical protein OHA61_37330 [Streptomyces sp. NBC_00885]